MQNQKYFRNSVFWRILRNNPSMRMDLLKGRFLICSNVLAISVLTLTGCGLSQDTKPTPGRTLNSATSSGNSSTLPCSDEERLGGSNWIAGQLNSFKKQDLKEAYKFASENFKSKFSFADFSKIIVDNYGILLKLKNFKVLYCEKKSDFYTFGVDLIDKENTKFQMNYVLTYLNEKWGVDAAGITI